MPLENRARNRRTVRRSSLRTGLFFETFALLALTVFAISIVAFFLSQNEFNVRTTQQLESIVEGKESLLVSTIGRQREQIAILGRDKELRNLPSVTALVGFRQLLKVDLSGNTTVLTGEKDMLPFVGTILPTLRDEEATVFQPIITDAGWKMYVITTPQFTQNVRTGTLVAIFDATGLASRILHTDSASKTMEILVATRMGDEDMVLHAENATDRFVPVHNANGTLSIVRDALSGKEGVANTTDYSGIPVLAAYRSIPALGWAIIAKIDRYEVQAPTVRFATNLVGTGLMIIVFLSLSTFFLGRRIVGPLEELTRKLDGLETKRWEFARSIFTGNELEIVDSAADELTKRLRTSHEHLELMVAERTQELRKQHAEDAAILQSMDDGLVVTDSAGIVTYVNAMAETLTGRTDAVGTLIGDFLLIADKDGTPLTNVNHPVTSVLSTCAAFHPSIDPQLMLKKADGTQTALQIRVTPILRGKKCIGSVAVLRDITEERRIDRMKSEFISLVSHQLRTPLSSMRWYLEMLLAEDTGPLTKDQHEYVSQVATSNARMVHLVNVLLNVSKIELGKFQITPETIDLQKLVHSAASVFDLELKQRKITLVFECPNKTVTIRSDRGLLDLIIENFLSNAIKYSHPQSSIRVTITENTVEKTASLSVTDTGIGIPEIQKPHIGQKLFRGSNAKLSDTDGNGLGLYISRIAAETIGAKFSFESAENTSTSFSIIIPLNPQES